MASVTSFLGIRFLDADLGGVRRAIEQHLATSGYGYAVTPNVDHVVTYHQGGDMALREAYDGATLHICDSRILSALARPSGRKLIPTPGSDLTRDLLERELPGTPRIAVIGPSCQGLRQLTRRYPRANLMPLASARQLVRGTDEWCDTVRSTCQAEWDILLICLSFPKQELFARDLALAGRQHGLALCVGASIDFLIGVQHRAPKLMQKAGLEWLHRLATNPNRMWRRYLVRGPGIFRLAARQYALDARRALRISRSG